MGRLLTYLYDRHPERILLRPTKAKGYKREAYDHLQKSPLDNQCLSWHYGQKDRLLSFIDYLQANDPLLKRFLDMAKTKEGKTLKKAVSDLEKIIDKIHIANSRPELEVVARTTNYWAVLGKELGRESSYLVGTEIYMNHRAMIERIKSDPRKSERAAVELIRLLSTPATLRTYILSDPEFSESVFHEQRKYVNRECDINLRDQKLRSSEQKTDFLIEEARLLYLISKHGNHSAGMGLAMRKGYDPLPPRPNRDSIRSTGSRKPKQDYTKKRY